jgi:hypothetical protein
MEKMRNIYKILARMRSLAIPRCKWEDTVKMGPRKVDTEN